MAENILSKFGDQNDIKILVGALQAEMQKASQTPTTTANITEIEYDEEIQNRVRAESPFLRFLESKNRVQPSKSSVIGWRNKKAVTTSKFTPPNGVLSGHDAAAKEWERLTQNMKVITYPIEVDILAQMGQQTVDLIDDDRQDGYADIAARKDKSILLGDSNSDPYSFNGINKLAPSQNKEDLNGEEITIEVVDQVIDQVIAQGGVPDCLVTTARVARQLTTEQQLNEIKVNTLEFVPGGWMDSYKTPGGVIPVITDTNLVTFEEDEDGNVNIDPDSEDYCFIVDSNGILNKNLLPVSEFKLAQTDLSDKSLLATFTALGIKAPWKQGVISGIGNGT
jgi:hypothetical protein